jgi:MoaA/NifB/PqqE/SkfB family radical SAM enzyme
MRVLEFPNNIQIETTSRCNAHCTFCPYPETSKTQPAGVMADDLFDSIIDQISRYPVQLIQPFLNNDPLMDPQIVPRLERIIRKNPLAHVRVTTNGSTLTEPIARALAAMPLETIHISSNGLTAATYRETMGLDGYTVLRNVNYLWDELRRRGSATRLVVTAILMRANQHEVQQMRDYWRSRGVEFYLNPLNHRAGNLSQETFRSLLPLSTEAQMQQLLNIDMSGCPALYSYMGILWNGDLITCCMDWRRARVLGNAREAPLLDLWHGGLYQRLRWYSDRGRLSEVPLCRECGDNRFSIDREALRDLVARQGEASPSGAVEDPDGRVLSMLDRFEHETAGVFQLGLIRRTGASA